MQDGVQKIPILGDIPFLGRLFRTDAVQVTKTNLLIFIRPTFIRDDDELEGALAKLKLPGRRETRAVAGRCTSNLMDSPLARN